MELMLVIVREACNLLLLVSYLDWIALGEWEFMLWVYGLQHWSP
jgi:hypothetical protein